ncbi:MAG TPA: cation diffusion facilitator family transporter, partial [Bacteroidia bacterium]
GKIENISAGFEGALIVITGISIIAGAVYGFFSPPELKKLDVGLLLSAFAGLCNYFMGAYLVKKGKQYNSILMVADGKHLIADTISGVGLVIGLALIYFTNVFWIDNILAIIFGGAILFTGYNLIKESVFNLLDKADLEKLNHLIAILNKRRREKWIDMHNLRILKYGSRLHVDAHLTLPWYDSLEEAHEEVDAVEKIMKKDMGDEIEFFIHADPCLPSSCPICSNENCTHRKNEFVRKLDWTIENLLPDSKHRI